MSDKPEALRLADALDQYGIAANSDDPSIDWAVAILRDQHDRLRAERDAPRTVRSIRTAKPRGKVRA